MSNVVKFVSAICAEKWRNVVKCKRACTMVVPDVPELRSHARDMLKMMQENCPMRDKLKDKPKFISLDKK